MKTANKTVAEIKLLATEINKFTYDLCPYTYQDSIDALNQTEADFIKDIRNMILENNQSLIDQLQQTVEYGDYLEDIAKAQDFINRIKALHV